MATNDREERLSLETLDSVAAETPCSQVNQGVAAKQEEEDDDDMLLEHVRDLLKNLDTDIGQVPSMTSILFMESVEREPVQTQMNADSAKKVAPIGNRSARKRSRKKSARQK